MTTRFRPSLTKEQLHDIGQRMDPADIPALLWDIKRLRAAAMRADQLLRSNDASGVLRSALRAELDQLACIQEDAATRREFWGKDM